MIKLTGKQEIPEKIILAQSLHLHLTISRVKFLTLTANLGLRLNS